jgi:hypothetical protein
VSENGVDVKKEGTSKQDSLLELQHILNNLTLDVSDHDLNELYQLAESASNTDNDIKHVTEQVYSKFTSDREYAKTGAFICEKLASLEVNGTKFRSLLLSMIQADYKGTKFQCFLCSCMGMAFSFCSVCPYFVSGLCHLWMDCEKKNMHKYADYYVKNHDMIVH